MTTVRPKSQITIELLTPQRAAELWPEMEPLFAQSCASNPVGQSDITPQDIFVGSQTDKVVIFAAFDDGKVATVLALQFHTTNGKKGVDMIAMAGRNLLRFKAAFWKPILEWLRANEVQFVDAYATPQLARLYMTKFGFNLSCTFVRMTL